MSDHTSPNDENDDHLDDDAYQTEFDPLTDNVSEELIKAVATLKDADPTELVLLAEFVDPEALDTLFGPRTGAMPRKTNGHVVFRYDEYHVLVDSSGTIRLYQETEIDGGGSPVRTTSKTRSVCYSSVAK